MPTAIVHFKSFIGCVFIRGDIIIATAHHVETRDAEVIGFGVVGFDHPLRIDGGKETMDILL